MTFKIFTDAESVDFFQLYSKYILCFPKDEVEDINGFRKLWSLVGDKKLSDKYGDFREYWIAAYLGNQIAGGINVCMFKFEFAGVTHRTMHINYVFSCPEFRGKGIASALIHEVYLIFEPSYIFIEVNDPEKMTDDELLQDEKVCGISTKERLHWWSRRGFRKINIDYVQPPLSSLPHAVCNMSLLVDSSNSVIDRNVVYEDLFRFFSLAVFKGRRPSKGISHLESFILGMLRYYFLDMLGDDNVLDLVSI